MKKLGSPLRNFSRLPRFQSGFTLTDLLISAAIVSITVVLGGVGMSTMVASSRSLTEGNERQDELNRALDFISTEIRQASYINKGAPPDYKSSVDASVVDTTSLQEILWLNIRGQDVVYYVAKPLNDNGPWRSPQVLFRWGSSYATDGQLTGTRKHRVLMDSLHGEINQGNPPVCVDTDWKQPTAPDVAKNLGFYACVAPNYRTAQLFQVGHVQKVLEQVDVIQQERQVYSRSSSPPSITPPTPNVFSNESSRIFEDGAEDLTEITIRPRGGEITCRSRGATISIPTEISVVWSFPNSEPETQVIPRAGFTREVPAGTKVHFIARRLPTANCGIGEYRVDSTQDEGTQVLALNNNDPIPFYRPFERQASIDSFLSDSLDENNLLSIAENQKVFLFELGEVYSPNPGPAYDFQDIVLLTEVSPVTRQVPN